MREWRAVFSARAALSMSPSWQRASDDAYAQAVRLTWERTLEPLDEIAAEAAARRADEGKQRLGTPTAGLHGSSR